MESNAGRRLIRPLSLLLDVLIWSTVAVLLVIFAGSVAGWDLEWSIRGFGNSRVCVESPANGEYRITGPGAPELESGAQARAGEIIVCKDDPRPRERRLGALTEIPGFILTGGLLIGLRVLLSRVRRRGPSDVTVGRFAERLGVGLTVGAVLCALVAHGARMVFIEAVTVSGDALIGWGDVVGTVDVAAITLGLALVVAGRILRLAAADREDQSVPEVHELDTQV
ncbi:hypothetical protein [Acrocarpospora catenulata]|uniref:hypothetical protein n=1 Tax=Acrocarpospora catenulata TaxID=2836182 RepID=UPI001BD9BA61|nr:hypothetical protein [Acrocarpospora catenulata]